MGGRFLRALFLLPPGHCRSGSKADFLGEAEGLVDVLIIGGGIAGCSLLYELSRYQVDALLIEKENDLSVGTTKANSAIVHAGYDPEPGTRMAKYNVEGNAYIKELCQKLDVPYRQAGSLVLALADDQLETLRKLHDRGVQNGVPGLRILTGEEARELEPALSPEVRGALLAPSAGIVSPWGLALALAETAVRNGARVRRDTEALAIRRENGRFVVETNRDTIEARFVVNAAGVLCDRVHDMACPHRYTVEPSRGEYYLLDKSQGTLVNHVIFQCPSKVGKGVLVSPTVDGNLIVGPNAEPSSCDNTATTATGLDVVRAAAAQSVPGVGFRDSIRNFSGVRAVTGEEDFILGESEDVPGFFEFAGMKSPGLTSAPAIARDMVGWLGEAGLALAPRAEFIDTRRVLRMKKLLPGERAEAIRQDPRYGRIICRCETITEGEIVAALHSPIPPVSLDGVKRRCGAGMGRCQGGFCGPRVQQIIARELGTPQSEVMLDRAGSRIITGDMNAR